MKYIETPWIKISRFFSVCLGLPFTIIGILYYFYDGNIAFLLNGVLWMVLAVLLELKDIWNGYCRKKIMSFSDCYEASSIKIIPFPMIKVGSYITVRLLCTYQGDEGRREVISGFYLLSPLDKWEKIHALVYISKHRNSRYEVFAFRMEDVQGS